MYEMVKDLISVITPCYNTGKYIHNLLDSILSQTYPKVEMYAVDDGSTDNTADVIKSYIPKFEQRGYSLNYIYQDNSGQSVAVNNALKLVKGEFLTWPDSDDFYASKEAFDVLIKVLASSSPKVGMVRCLYSNLDEDNFSIVKKQMNLPCKHNNNQFEDCLYVKNNWYFLSGGYFVKMDILDTCILHRDIYTSHDAGQNWQLMLPILYSHKCITVNKYLYNVVVRADSHSRGQYKTYSQQKNKFKAYENTILGTLDRMSELDKRNYAKYYQAIQLKYAHIQLWLAITYQDKYNIKLFRNKITKDLSGHLNFKESLACSLYYIPGWLNLFNFVRKIVGGILKFLR